jgi:GrpB-like predicted nucleotidyltransferase (UPF0157 family)/predicted DNA-binding protein (MmcQ/YjbR family)
MKEKQQVIDYCLTFENVYEDNPFSDQNWTVIRHNVSKKVFAWIFEKDGFVWVNVKCDPQWISFWRNAFEAVIPAYHLNKEHWNSIILNGTIPVCDIRTMIGNSYDLILKKIKKDKKLTDMTLEELWQLFPIQLVNYNPAWADWYESEKTALLASLGDMVAQIDHIGSTSVNGLLAKPIVDILLQIAQGSDYDRLKSVLSQNGWLLMSQQNPPSVHSDWNKGYTPNGFAKRVFHLHIRETGDWDEFYFRDYLAAHAEAAREYEALKRSLAIKFRHNRDAYTEAKTSFIQTCTAKGREFCYK